MGYPSFGLTFEQLRDANFARLLMFPGHDPANPWSANDWMVAVTGEVGELANLLKRARRGVVVRGKPLPTISDYAEELADIAIYLDLLAEYLGVDLAIAVRDKFNQVSAEIGIPVRL